MTGTEPTRSDDEIRRDLKGFERYGAWTNIGTPYDFIERLAADVPTLLTLAVAAESEAVSLRAEVARLTAIIAAQDADADQALSDRAEREEWYSQRVEALAAQLRAVTELADTWDTTRPGVTIEARWFRERLAKQLRAALAGDVPPPAETGTIGCHRPVDLGWFSSPASLLSPEVIAEVVARPKCICDGASYRTAEENAARQPFIVAANCPVHPVAASSPTPTLLEALGISAEDQAAMRERLSADFDRIREAERRAASAGQSVVLGASSSTLSQPWCAFCGGAHSRDDCAEYNRDDGEPGTEDSPGASSPTPTETDGMKLGASWPMPVEEIEDNERRRKVPNVCPRCSNGRPTCADGHHSHATTCATYQWADDVCDKCKAELAATEPPVYVFGAGSVVYDPLPSPTTENTDPTAEIVDHPFKPVSGHWDDDECTYRVDGTDLAYCGEPEASHESSER